jgi:hypothetical protein
MSQDQDMVRFWALIRTSSGAQIRIYVMAPNQYIATEMLKAQYGTNLLSPAAFA